MKLVLSRKGFDGHSGGVASPIFPDGRMVSLPIPTRRSPSKYSQVAWGDGNLGQVTLALTKGKIKGLLPAHLDPDLDALALPRVEGWRPAFGQIGAAQTHLANQDVSVGDLFLFFGWFRRVEEEAGTGALRFVPGSPDMHVLFGWLQVGEVLVPGEFIAEHRQTRPWLANHPHLDQSYAWREGNTIYVAADRLIIDGQETGCSGGGTFKRFHDGLRLTAPDSRKRSFWQLPGWFLPDSGPCLSYHQSKPWTQNGTVCTVETVGRGQEFVMDVSDRLADLEAWFKTLHANACNPAP